MKVTLLLLAAAGVLIVGAAMKPRLRRELELRRSARRCAREERKGHCIAVIEMSEACDFRYGLEGDTVISIANALRVRRAQTNHFEAAIESNA